MYGVLANINAIENRTVLLKDGFQPNVTEILNKVDKNTKILFLCSPNNPSGNSFSNEMVEKLLSSFSGLVVIDEAYVEFSKEESFISQLEHYPNLVVCQTFSKAQGLAGARLGMAFAHPMLIQFLNRIKAPYNINSLTIAAALKRLEEQDRVLSQVDYILKERMKLETKLPKISFIAHCFPSDANFILVKVDNSALRYDQLIDQGIVVRNPSKNRGCENTLRITVGRAEENNALLTALKNMES
jgi:histidinol-phosphate aminotransferase